MAVANTGDQRIHEYAPTRGVIDSSARRKRRSRGWLRRYGRFLIEELKPFIDRTYRTRIDAEFDRTWRVVVRRIGHARARALVSARFQPARRLSPSVWWDECVVCRMVGELPKKLPLKIWLDTGNARTGLGAGPGVARSVGREGLAAQSRSPIHRSGGRRSQRARLGGAFRGGVAVLVSAIAVRDEGSAAKPFACRNGSLGVRQGRKLTCSPVRQAPFLLFGSAKFPSLRNFA